LPRLTGISVVVLLAAGGVTAYLLASRPPVTAHKAPLPTKVLALQTVGLVVSGPSATSSGTAVPQMLLDSPAGLAFGPVPQSILVTGNPEWTADQMAGGTYIFIYIPSGRCLGSAASRPAPELALQRCNLGPGQRWRPEHPAIAVAGRSYQKFSNLSTGTCMSAGTARPAAGPADDAAELAPCSAVPPWRQLVSFWWGT
jgi:hypothetical protein